MAKHPIIGVTPDFSIQSAYSSYPHYQLRQTYTESIKKSGGIPLILSYDINQIDDYLNIINGLVITGGGFDIDPELYGSNINSEHVNLNLERTKFEWAILQKAIDLKMPILGICGGEQLLNVVLGGDLIQHIPDEVESNIEHEQTNPKHEVSHSINIISNSLLYEIIGQKEQMMVNSTHHQAVKNLGKNLKISAIADDGIIEAIEHETHPFCLGVQWHPDHLPTIEDSKILEAFIEACNQYN